MSSYNAQAKTTLDTLLLSIPGVEAGRLFGYPGYKLNGKAFVILCGSGIAVKLPEARADMLTDLDGDISHFAPTAGRMWRTWVYVNRGAAADYSRDWRLFEEALNYARGDVLENESARSA